MGHYFLMYTFNKDLKNLFTLTSIKFQTVALEKTLESPSESKGIKPVNSKDNQPWIFIERIDTEAFTPILWPPVEKS